MLSESQLDRYSALLKRLKGLPADQREDVLRAMRAPWSSETIWSKTPSTESARDDTLSGFGAT